MQNGECFTMQTLGTFFAATVIIRKINDLHCVMTQRYPLQVLVQQHFDCYHKGRAIKDIGFIPKNTKHTVNGVILRQSFFNI